MVTNKLLEVIELGGMKFQKDYFEGDEKYRPHWGLFSLDTGQVIITANTPQYFGQALGRMRRLIANGHSPLDSNFFQGNEEWKPGEFIEWMTERAKRVALNKSVALGRESNGKFERAFVSIGHSKALEVRVVGPIVITAEQVVVPVNIFNNFVWNYYRFDHDAEEKATKRVRVVLDRETLKPIRVTA